MPYHRYMPQTNEAPPISCVNLPSPSARLHGSRKRELSVKAPRTGAYRRRSPRNNGDKTPILDNERKCCRSSSSSSPEPRKTRQEPASDLEPSPSYNPKGFLVFVDSSFEREEDTHAECILTSPKDVQPLPLSSEGGVASTSDFEPDPAFTGSPPQTPAGCLNVTASSGPICRICHEGDQQEELASFCKCSGTMGLLHASCLEHWLNAQNVDHCELCRHRFPTSAQFSTARRFFHWALYSETRVQRAVLGDLFCFALLAPVAVLTCLLCAHSASKKALHGHVWESAGLVMVAALLLTACVAWSFLTIRFHYRTFQSWQSMNPARRIVAPVDGVTAAAIPASPRELDDVVIGPRDEVVSSSPQGPNSDVDARPLSLTRPEEQYSEQRQPLHGPSSDYVFW
ncbi:uncharacterized protein LOC144155803 [Haemaphysalis longicornis]